MRTKMYTSNGTDRFLVLEILEEDDLANVERFVGRSYSSGENGAPMLKTLNGTIPVHVGDRIVYTNGTITQEVEVGGEMYAEPYLIFNEHDFHEKFEGAVFVR